LICPNRRSLVAVGLDRVCRDPGAGFGYAAKRSTVTWVRKSWMREGESNPKASRRKRRRDLRRRLELASDVAETETGNGIERGKTAAASGKSVVAAAAVILGGYFGGGRIGSAEVPEKKKG
jgi:hypothetical protein